MAQPRPFSNTTCLYLLISSKLIFKQNIKFLGLKPALSKDMRRGSSGSSMDDNFLTVPQTVTASSSAETLTGFYVLSIPFLGHNHVHLTEWFGFVNRHLSLGNFGKCNRCLRARTLRLHYPKSSVTFPFS